MIRLVQARKYLPNETLGTYIVFDDDKELFRCKSIELPWLNNQQGVSCIPGEKIYNVVKMSTPKHPNSFLIKDVPGRTAIMIHIGNFATGATVNTEGCQLPGMNFVDIDGNGTLDVAQSTLAMESLNHFLPDSFKLYIL
jgi:hypothetical protein